MQPGPAASAIQVTSCGMGAKTAPRGADHLVRRGTTAPCRTGARAQSGGSMRAGADRRQLPIVTGFLADFARNADLVRVVGCAASRLLGYRTARSVRSHDGV